MQLWTPGGIQDFRGQKSQGDKSKAREERSKARKAERRRRRNKEGL